MRQIDLHGHQIAPGDHLGHRVLDLDACVHFQEEELEALGVHDELDGARPCVTRGLAEVDGRLRHGLQNGSGSPGAGLSSITFWKRRCSEQSRSKRWMASPLPKPKTWISICRALGTKRSRNIAPLLNDFAAMDWVAATVSTSFSAPSTRRMPMPPPPPAAFTRSG